MFDTAFHQTMPPHAYMYGLPYELYEKHKIRRYGFHGTSHKYLVEQAAGERRGGRLGWRGGGGVGGKGGGMHAHMHSRCTGGMHKEGDAVRRTLSCKAL